MTLTVGSLFAGIGGLELGLERAGMKVRWQVEIDPYARSVLAKHWPWVRRHDDVRTFLTKGNPNEWRTDLICGGFPCQDISNAGQRAGITGARSGLWSEYARVVGLLRPRYVLVENVDALAARGLDRVLGDLAALGYDAEWDRIPAAAVGAPHLRWRIFILAYAERQGLEGREDEIRGQGTAGSGRLSGDQGVADVPDATSRFAGSRWREQFQAHCQGARDVYWPDAESWLRRVADGLPGGVDGSVFPTCFGVPHRADRLRCLGNAVVPQISQWIGERIMNYERSVR